MKRVYSVLYLFSCLASYSFAQEAYRYSVAGESQSRAWFSALQRAAGESEVSNASPDIELRQRYRYSLTVSRLGNGSYEARWSDWRADNATSTEMSQLLEQIQSLSPAYYRLSETGALEFFSPTGREAWQRQAVASILYPFQFVRPKNASREWRTEEWHPSGRIVCRYRLVREEKDGVRVYNKAIVEVLLTPEERQVGKSHQIRGHLQYRMDAAGVIQSISGTLREQIEVYGTPASQNEVKYDIRLQSHTRLSHTNLQAKRERLARLQGAWFNLYAPPSESEQEQARALSHLRDTSQTQVIAELDALLARVDKAESIPAAEQNKLRLKLDAGLIVYGAPFLNELKTRLQARPRDDEGFWLLTGVLSQSSAPEAQKVLVEVFLQSTSEAMRRGIAQQVAFLRAPHRETIETLWKQARAMPFSELQQVLLVSLSNLARRLREQAPELLREMSAWYISQLQAAQDAPAQQFWITALGALGDPDSLLTIEQYARRGEELTRLSAIEILGYQPPQAALPLLERLYTIEPAAAVREKMVQLLTNWWNMPEACALMEKAAFNDPAMRVRKACVQSLRLLAAQHEDALQLLVNIAETNSEPTIRREAMIALAALRASGVSVPNVKAAP